MAPATPDPTPHQILKDGERTPHPYRVTMGDDYAGSAIVDIGPLRSGGAYHFNRLTEDEKDRTAILRLTTPEARTLRQQGFTVERVEESEIETDDPFETPDDDEDETETAVSESDWTLAMTPIAYLETKPDGPKAQLAHDMIAAGFGNASTRNEE